jgi:hypothetical protein
MARLHTVADEKINADKHISYWPMPRSEAAGYAKNQG